MIAFNVQDELTVLQNQTKMIRKRSYSARKSQLDKYKFELLELKKAGASTAELQRWLRTNKRKKVAHSTILRWLEKHG
ncbi:hypothetical protein GLP20_18215 [Photobacterium carnosum]|nr:hypothetical protein [Photobacterium carnosum]